MKNLQIFGYVLAGAIIIWIVYRMMRKIGLIDSAAEIKEQKQKEADVLALKDSEYFNQNLYKNTNYGYAHLLPSETSTAKARLLYSSFGVLNDNEERIYSVFRTLDNKIQISQISDAFYQLYKLDLLGEIIDAFNDSEMAFLWQIIKSKPNS